MRPRLVLLGLALNTAALVLLLVAYLKSDGEVEGAYFDREIVLWTSDNRAWIAAAAVLVVAGTVALLAAARGRDG